MLFQVRLTAVDHFLYVFCFIVNRPAFNLCENGNEFPSEYHVATNNNNNKMYIFRARIQITSYLSMALYNDKSL